MDKCKSYLGFFQEPCKRYIRLTGFQVQMLNSGQEICDVTVVESLYLSQVAVHLLEQN